LQNEVTSRAIYMQEESPLIRTGRGKDRRRRDLTIFAWQPGRLSGSRRHCDRLIEIEQAKGTGADGFHCLAGLRELGDRGSNPGGARPGKRKTREDFARLSVPAAADAFESGATLTDAALDLFELGVGCAERAHAAKKRFRGIESAGINELLRLVGNLLADSSGQSMHLASARSEGLSAGEMLNGGFPVFGFDGGGSIRDATFKAGATPVDVGEQDIGSRVAGV
jgi:hypothetical protein